MDTSIFSRRTARYIYASGFCACSGPASCGQQRRACGAAGYTCAEAFMGRLSCSRSVGRSVGLCTSKCAGS
jgi:hypothetical protein